MTAKIIMWAVILRTLLLDKQLCRKEQKVCILQNILGLSFAAAFYSVQKSFALPPCDKGEIQGEKKYCSV